MPREDPLPFAVETVALELTPGKADIIEYTGQTVIRRDGVTGRVIWDAASPVSSYDRQHDPGPWLRQVGAPTRMVTVVEAAHDLDGDGTRDVVLAAASATEWLALSGKDGSRLWDHRAQRPRPASPGTQIPELNEAQMLAMAVGERFRAAPGLTTSMATVCPNW